LETTTADKFSDHKPITVHLTGEISVRDRAEPFQGAMFVGHPGDIVFSKIDARLGAIGVIPESLGTAVVTAEYPIHRPAHDALDADYLKMVLRTGHFIANLRQKASGTSGRKRVTPEAFRSLRVPCPGITEQRALIAAYQAALAQAATLEAEAAQLEAKGLRAFEVALGIVAPPPLPDRPLFVARFSDLGRWSHEAVLRRVSGTEPPPSPYPIVALEDVIADLSVGYSPRCLTEPAMDGEWGVLKLSAVTSGKFVARANKAVRSPSDVRPALQVKTGDVLVARGSGVTRFVGAACVVTDHNSKLLLSDLIFRIDFGTINAILPSFLAYILATPTVRRQIEETRTGAAPGIQKTTKGALLNLTFPMPTDITVQAGLVADLNAAQAAAAARRDEAFTTRRDAWRAFEIAIYGDASDPPLLDGPEDVVDEEGDQA
jgi:type I restriction enzyme S subunit